MPGERAHTVEVFVYYRDTDVGGNAYYGRYMEYFEIARWGYFRDLGFDVGRMFEEGTAFVVREARARYRRRAMLGQTLVVTTTIARLGRASVLFRHEVREKTSGELLAEGETEMVPVGAKDAKPRPFEPAVRTALEASCAATP